MLEPSEIADGLTAARSHGTILPPASNPSTSKGYLSMGAKAIEGRTFLYNERDESSY